MYLCIDTQNLLYYFKVVVLWCKDCTKCHHFVDIFKKIMMCHPSDAVDCLGKHAHVFFSFMIHCLCFYFCFKNLVILEFKNVTGGRRIGGWWCWCCDRLVRVVGLRHNWKRLLLCSRKWLRRHGQRTSYSRALRLLHRPTNWHLCRQKIVNLRCDSKYSFHFATYLHLGSDVTVTDTYFKEKSVLYCYYRCARILFTDLRACTTCLGSCNKKSSSCWDSWSYCMWCIN